jgi:hypothetical protein
MRSTATWVIAVASVAMVMGCSNNAGSPPSQPKFKVVAANWLLCPHGVDGLKSCCPQPADPRRCVFPNGAAPTELVAFARFTNAGAPGRATATFTNGDETSAACSAAVPFTEAGATTSAWCSLGAVFEPNAPPHVDVHPDQV